MKTKITLLIFALFVIAGSRTAMAQATADYDKEIDFTKYTTYTFKGWVQDSDKQIPEFDQKRILEAFKNELTARGMSGVPEGGDVAITLFVVLDQKSSTTAYTNYNGGYGYGGRWGWGYGGGMGSANTTYTTEDYIEGTSVIDFYDESTKNLVYQGIIKTEVNEKPEKREKTIPKNVKKLMAKYPVKPIKK
jgi:hypothetical protein